ADRLRDELNLAPGRRVVFEGAEAARFAVRLEAWEARTGGEAYRAIARRASLEPRLAVQGRSFDLAFEVVDGDADGATSSGRARVAAETVVRAWEDGLPLVPLDGGGWAPIPSAWLERHGGLVADLLAGRRGDGEC